MASFYGNMKNNSRASFIFDKIYPTRKAMEDALIAKDAEGAIAGDGIFINRYVLIDYHYSLADQVINANTIDEYYTKVDNSLVTIENFKIYYIRAVNNNVISYEHPTSFSNSNTYYQKKVFIDRYKPDDQIKNGELEQTTSALIETDLYYQHKLTDWQNYRASYDSTVWMKIYADNQERYIMVAELDAKAPILEFIDDAPSCYNGSGHFDMRASTDLNYIYYLPKNWDLIVNQYSPEYTYNDNTNEHYYYQQDKDTNDIWYEQYIPTTDTKVQANKDYFIINFTKVDNTVGKFISNLNYYVLVDNKYIRTIDTIGQENTDYYIMNYPILVDGLIVGTDINNNSNYYELNNKKKTFNDQVEYPYFNLKGFDQRVSAHVSEQGQGIYFSKVESTQTYPQHVFKHAGGLTVNTYLPNKYFTYIGPKQKVPENAIYNRDYAYYIGASSNPTSYEYVQLIILDDGTYKPGKPLETNQSYYYDNDLSNKNYFIKSTQWAKNTAYYEITQAVDSDGNKLVEHEDDTYRLDVYLPQIGNTVASIYDILYGAPKIESNKTDGYNNLIGYCSQEQWQTYNCIGYCSIEDKANYTSNAAGNYGIAADDKFDLTNDQLNNLRKEPVPTYTKVDNNIINDNNYWKYYIKTISSGQEIYKPATHTPQSDEEGYFEKGGYIIPVYLMDGSGDYWSDNRIFSLTDDQFHELSPEIYPGLYDIPVYLKEGSNVRPYDLDKLKSTLAPPYDNLENEDDISLGWTLTLLKRYLSELRYLANGKTGDEEHGIGLQSDWVLDNEESFGYIHHRPNIITNYTPTTDLYALPNKAYYKELVKNGEVIYEPLSDYYKQLTSTDYINAIQAPLLFTNNLYYYNQRTVYQKINNSNMTEVADNYGIQKKPIMKISQVNNVDASNYLNYYIQETDDIYIAPIVYNINLHFYDFQPLSVSDYANWYYQDQEDYILLITNDNADSVTGNIYVQDTNGTYTFVNDSNKYRLFTNNDLIGYYCDFDDNDSTPQTQISAENVDNVGNRKVYRFVNGAYIEYKYEGCYYVQNTIVYNPITTDNYDTTRKIYKKDGNEYTYLTPSDFINYYYQTDQDIYTQLSNDNYIRDRAKYKKVNDNYSLLTLEDFTGKSNKYYIYDSARLVYEEITTDNWNTFDINSDIYTYQQATIHTGDSLLNTGYTVYELPRSYSNGLHANKPEYIQCSNYSIYDPNAKYYIWDGAQFASASYVENEYYLDTDNIPINHSISGGVSYQYEYTVIVDANNNITDRIYQCYAGTSQDSIALYHNNKKEDNTWYKESVNLFNIHITNNNENTDAQNIYTDIVGITELARADVLTLLNNTLINNYGATYEIVSTHQNWPIENTEDSDIGFYYARQGVDYHNFDLDELHFYANPNRYYTLEQVPVEQEDYEIHNIWNSVLVNVLREP